MRRARRIGEKDRHAIGGHDDEGDVGLLGPERVGIRYDVGRRVPSGAALRLADLHDMRAVDLTGPGPGSQGGADDPERPRPVPPHELGVIPRGIREVERGERSIADAPVTGRERRPDTGKGERRDG